MNPSQHAEQFQSQLANYVPQFTPEFWPVWLIIAGVLLVGMWLVLGLHALLRARGVKKSATDHGEKIYLYSKAVRLWHWSNALLFVLLLASGLINHFALVGATAVKVWLRCMKFADFCYWHAGWLCSDQCRWG
ncbi:cytochrome b/b6 domain-containing protein [Escherichia coli]